MDRRSLLFTLASASGCASCGVDESFAAPGQGGDRTLAQARARALIEIANRPLGDLEALSSDRPVYAFQGVGERSSIIPSSTTDVRGGRFEPDDAARIATLGGALTAPGDAWRHATVIDNLTTKGRLGVFGDGLAFETEAPAFDLCMDTRGKDVCLYVIDLQTGRRGRAHSTDQVTPSGYRYHRWSLGPPKPRRIELYTPPTGAIRSINVARGHDVRAPAIAAESRIALVWDSWGAKASLDASMTNTRIKLGVPDWMGAVLGAANLVNLSVGATGMLATKGELGVFRDRILIGRDLSIERIGPVGAVLMPGSLNDHRFTDDQVRDAALATYRAAALEQPGALIYGMGPQSGQVAIERQSRHDACRDGFRAAAAGDPRFRWIDISPAGADLFTPATTQRWFGSDPFHPDALGMREIGQAIGGLILQDLKTLTARS